MTALDRFALWLSAAVVFLLLIFGSRIGPRWVESIDGVQLRDVDGFETAFDVPCTDERVHMFELRGIHQRTLTTLALRYRWRCQARERADLDFAQLRVGAPRSRVVLSTVDLPRWGFVLDHRTTSEYRLRLLIGTAVPKGGRRVIPPVAAAERLHQVNDDGEENEIPFAATEPLELDGIRARFLRDALAALKPRERETIELRFVEDMTLEEVAQRFGCTREWIRRLELSALKKMRRFARQHQAGAD